MVQDHKVDDAFMNKVESGPIQYRVFQNLLTL